MARGTGGGYIADVMTDGSHAATEEQAAAFHKTVLTGLVVIRRDKDKRIEPAGGFEAAWEQNWKAAEPGIRRAMLNRDALMLRREQQPDPQGQPTHEEKIARRKAWQLDRLRQGLRA